MIYTPENSPGSITVDVEKGEYIYDVLAVDMDNATVEVIDRPLRIVKGTDEIAKRKIRFRSIKALTGQPRMQQLARLFLCEGEIQPDTKE